MLRDGFPDGSSPAEAILVQPQAVGCPWATAESDASADALLDATEDVPLEPQHCLDEDAGKLADPVRGVQVSDALVLRPAQSAKMAQGAPCTPDEVPCEERSCAAVALALASAQSASLVSLPLESRLVEAHLTVSPQ